MRGFFLIRIFLPALTKTRFLQSCDGAEAPPTIYAVLCVQTMIAISNSLTVKGGRAPNHGIGPGEPGPLATTGCPACESAALGCDAWRSIQYSRTANLRAMATLATALPRRNFNRW